MNILHTYVYPIAEVLYVLCLSCVKCGGLFVVFGSC